MIINPEFLDMYLYFLERSKNPRPGRETLGDLFEDMGGGEAANSHFQVYFSRVLKLGKPLPGGLVLL